MPAFSDYVIYVDESGDHSLTNGLKVYPSSEGPPRFPGGRTPIEHSRSTWYEEIRLQVVPPHRLTGIAGLRRLPVDNLALDWQGEGMRGNGNSTGMQWGLLIFGALFGLVCAVLILTEVLSPTLWFTVIAMGCLVLSQALLIRSKRRNR